MTTLVNTVNAALICLAIISAPESAWSSARSGEGNDNISTASEVLARDLADSLYSWLSEKLPERGVPGAAAVVVDRTGVVRLDTWGFTGGPGSSKVNEDTLFCIRSVSKNVTSLAVLMAVQEGLLDLDTPINVYLPEFTVNSLYENHAAGRITLRHMLSHWASFTHDPPVGINTAQPGYFDDYISRISGTWLRFPVGYRHQYSNYGYDLAAHILEARSGQSFARYVKKKVLEPIGMSNSTFDLDSVGNISSRATGHRKGKPVPIPFPEIASAGLYSNVIDMAKLTMLHLNNGIVDGKRLLRKDLMDQYHAIQFARSDQKTGYTLGLIREPVGSTHSLYHEGGGRGFGSQLMIYPEIGIAAVLLTNLEYHGLTGQAGRIVMNGPVLERFGPRIAADSRIAGMGRLEPDDPRVLKVLGRYGDSPGVHIGTEDRQGWIRTADERTEPLHFHDDGGELVAMYGQYMEVRFLAPYGEQLGSMMIINRMVGNSNNHYLGFNDSPADPLGPDKPAWQDYVGSYDVIWEDEPSSTAKVEVRNGYLYFRDGKCREFRPGMFISYDGEVLDFNSSLPTFATQEIRKRKAAPDNSLLQHD